MSGTATLAVVLLVFFVAGIGAGVVAVIALPARHTRPPLQPDPDPWSQPEPDPDPWSQPGPWPEPEPERGWPVSEDDEGGGWGRND